MSKSTPPPEFTQAQLDYLKRHFPVTNPRVHQTLSEIQRQAGAVDVVDHIEWLVKKQEGVVITGE